MFVLFEINCNDDRASAGLVHSKLHQPPKIHILGVNTLQALAHFCSYPIRFIFKIFWWNWPLKHFHHFRCEIGKQSHGLAEKHCDGKKWRDIVFEVSRKTVALFFEFLPLGVCLKDLWLTFTVLNGSHLTNFNGSWTPFQILVPYWRW